MCRILDKMDAKKCNIPHLAIETKSWDNQKGLQSQFVGAINHGIGTQMYMFDEPLPADSNLNTTIFYHGIVEEFERRKEQKMPWPRVLYVQCDSASDNKNKSFFMLCEMFVRLGIFAKVKISFLPVGHTHEDIDACFGAGSHILHRCNAFNLEEVHKCWSRAWPSTKAFEYIAVTTLIF